LADEYGVNCAVILNIIKNETYTDSGWGKKLPEIKDKLKKDWSKKQSKKRSGEDGPRSKLTNKQVKKIRDKWKDGKEIEDLTDEYGVNCLVITRILRNETYTDPEWEKKLPEIKDKLEKDRVRKQSKKVSGENGPKSKLTNKQVEEIRDEWWNSKKEIEDLADKCGINCLSMTRILRNETYKNPEWEKKLPEIKDKLKKDASRKRSEKRSGEDSPRSKLTNEQVKEIRDEWKDGISICNLAEGYDVSQGIICGLVRNETYKSLKWGEELSKILESKKQEEINRNENIVKDRQSGMRYKTLVEKYKLSEYTIIKIIKKTQ
jgi:Mor family transcriptional regulator